MVEAQDQVMSLDCYSAWKPPYLVVNKDIFKGHSRRDPQSVQLQHYAKLVTEMTPRNPRAEWEEGPTPC
jgi:hypothetical protein